MPAVRSRVVPDAQGEFVKERIRDVHDPPALRAAVIGLDLHRQGTVTRPRLGATGTVAIAVTVNTSGALITLGPVAFVAEIA